MQVCEVETTDSITVVRRVLRPLWAEHAPNLRHEAEVMPPSERDDVADQSDVRPTRVELNLEREELAGGRAVDNGNAVAMFVSQILTRGDQDFVSTSILEISLSSRGSGLDCHQQSAFMSAARTAIGTCPHRRLSSAVGATTSRNCQMLIGAFAPSTFQREITLALDRVGSSNRTAGPQNAKAPHQLLTTQTDSNSVQLKRRHPDGLEVLRQTPSIKGAGIPIKSTIHVHRPKRRQEANARTMNPVIPRHAIDVD